MLYDRSGGSGTLLFDEIEKAHKEILDVFLQILSAGRFTLANGETLDLRNYVIVATSNIGSRMLMESKTTDRETLVTRTEPAGAQEINVAHAATSKEHFLLRLSCLIIPRTGRPPLISICWATGSPSTHMAAFSIGRAPKCSE